MVCGVVAVLWFRIPSVVRSATSPQPNVVSFTRVSASDAALLDKTPLFLPTRWNTSREDVKMPDASGALAPYQAKFAFSNSELKLENLPVAVVTPTGPADALTIPSQGPLFGGLSRSDSTVAPLSKRGAYLEVVAASTGRRILGESLSGAAPPGAGGWQTLEFVANINASGLVSLNLTMRSGVEEVDVYFSRFLAQKFRIGARLSPGFYRISVGP